MARQGCSNCVAIVGMEEGLVVVGVGRRVSDAGGPVTATSIG